MFKIKIQGSLKEPLRLSSTLFSDVSEVMALFNPPAKMLLIFSNNDYFVPTNLILSTRIPTVLVDPVMNSNVPVALAAAELRSIVIG